MSLIRFIAPRVYRQRQNDAHPSANVQKADQYTGFNRVGAQDPAPGETVSWGTTVTITIF